MHKLNRGVTTDYRHILYDVMGNLLVFALCHGVFYGLGRDNLSIMRTGLVALGFLWFYVLVCKDLKLYDTTTFFYTDRVVRRITGAFVASVALAAAALYFAGRAMANRDFYISYFLASYAEFLLMSYVAYRRNKSETAHRRTLLIGTKGEFETMLGYMRKTNLGMNLVGFVKYEHDDPEEEREAGYLGFAQDGELEGILHSHMVDQVYLLQEKGRYQSLSSCLTQCIEVGVVTHVVIPPMRRGCASYVSSIGTYPVLSYHVVSLDTLQSMIKRVMDVIGAVIGIVLSSPLLLLSAVAIKLDSKGPVLFCQSRVGRNGREFKIYKLRSMCSDAEAKKKELERHNEMKGHMFKMEDDPRITRVGKVLRKTSIDELPQFFNVLKGDMSLVGTRPPTKNEVAAYESHHWRRLSIKPGITGLWQTSGRSAITDFDEVVALDTEYIEHWSLWLDIKLLFKTVGVLVTRKGAQ